MNFDIIKPIIEVIDKIKLETSLEHKLGFNRCGNVVLGISNGNGKNTIEVKDEL